MNARKREALLFLLVFAYSCFCFYGGHFNRGAHAYSMVEDDLYYYLRIASNLVAGHGSTFDGETATNGYHPLWMGVIALLSVFTSNVKHLIAAIYGIAVVSTLATFLLSGKLLKRFVSNAALADIAAVVVTLFASDLYRSGMEIIATIPLALGLIVLILQSKPPWPPRRVFGITLLAAFTVLSRIDSAILVGLLGLTLLCDSGIRHALKSRHWPAIALGALPLVLYLLSNIVFFGALLPISGQAKQLRTTYFPSLRGLRSTPWICPLHGLPFLAALFGLAWFLFVRKRFDGVTRATLTAVLVFPVAQMLLLSVLSDWILFPWYFYSSAIALCAALSVVLGEKTALSWARNRFSPVLTGAFAIVCLLYAARIVGNTWRRPPSQRVMAGLFVERFAASHPGRYAMGDRAGFAGVVLPYPLIQLEGLVMDKRFLKHIRNQDNLLSVLHEYRVDYYVATQMSGELPQGCFPAGEPLQAGDSAPHMRASLCMPPAAVYQTPNGVKTLIFDLNTTEASR